MVFRSFRSGRRLSSRPLLLRSSYRFMKNMYVYRIYGLNLIESFEYNVVTVTNLLLHELLQTNEYFSCQRM